MKLSLSLLLIFTLAQASFAMEINKKLTLINPSIFVTGPHGENPRKIFEVNGKGAGSSDGRDFFVALDTEPRVRDRASCGKHSCPLSSLLAATISASLATGAMLGAYLSKQGS